ncbi:hypothetical protein [Fictibacillus sp. KU28468]|uniref:hypothetical protein n=1 Tax=Fictibacillus sp. KU28468 TaxID=2991053 RepID=UPI00223D2881|nr:hypothetical protein [Fictibacillus sp. KU28468]UZJ76903.1 hypothetical protein OKX00_11810 [Fictibacillus sp. KU28468]
MISAPGCSLLPARAPTFAGRAVSRVNAYFLALAPAGVSPVTLVPQDKEDSRSVLSHEENVKFIFEESRTFHFNQLFIEDFQDKKELLKVNFRLSGQPLFKLGFMFLILESSVKFF